MEKRIKVPGELTLVVGVIMISFSISLMVKADFGISTISSLPYVLSVAFDQISFGVWNPIFQVGLLVIMVAITKRFKGGYVISLLISAMFGSIIDLFSWMTAGLPTDLGFRVLYVIVSYPIMCFAISMMVNSKVPLMVVDAFINDLTRHFHVTFRRLKTIFDIICLSLSIIFSFAFMGELVGVGIATILMAFITGSGVHVATKVLRNVMDIRPWSKTLANLA